MHAHNGKRKGSPPQILLYVGIRINPSQIIQN